MADAARQLCELVHLGRQEREQRVRLEALPELGRDDRERLLADQPHRIELRVERARDLVGLRERLADESEARRQTDAVHDRDSLQVGERLAGADVRERAPVVARQLSPQLVDEPGLVCVEERQ